MAQAQGHDERFVGTPGGVVRSKRSYDTTSRRALADWKRQQRLLENIKAGIDREESKERNEQEGAGLSRAERKRLQRLALLPADRMCPCCKDGPFIESRQWIRMPQLTPESKVRMLCVSCARLEKANAGALVVRKKKTYEEIKKKRTMDARLRRQRERMKRKTQELEESKIAFPVAPTTGDALPLIQGQELIEKYGEDYTLTDEDE